MLVKDLFDVITKYFEETHKTDYYDVHIVDIEFDDEYTTNADEVKNGIFDKRDRGNCWGLAHIENWKFDGNTFEINVSWTQHFSID